MGRTHIGAVREGLSPVGGTLRGAGEECVEEGAAETVYFILVSQYKPMLTLPFSLLFCHFAGKHDT